jgi:hypothetical protein
LSDIYGNILVISARQLGRGFPHTPKIFKQYCTFIKNIHNSKMSQLQNKDKRITIRLRKESERQLSERAEQSNMTLSEYVRRQIEGQPIRPPKVAAVNWKLYGELFNLKVEINRVGTNINQIAKVLNTEKMLEKELPQFLPNPESLNEAIELIERTRELLSTVRLSLIGVNDR